MDTNDAINILSDFLVGSAVRPDQLDAAHRLLAAEMPEALARLRREFGLDQPPAAGCREIRAAMNELIRHGWEELGGKFPLLAAHLDQCPTCSRLWWLLKPAWKMVGPVDDPALRKARSELIVLKLGPRGMSVVTGPPAIERTPAAVAMDKKKNQRISIKEWKFPDPETGMNAILKVWVAARGKIQLEFDLDGPEKTAPEKDQVRVELFSQESPLPLLDLPLTGTAQPITLTPGSYRLILSWPIAGKTHLYEIPFTIRELQ